MPHLFGVFAVQTEGLTGAGSVNPRLKGGNGVKRGKVAAVEVSEVVEEGVGTDPNFLQKSWMPSWTLTMPRYVPT